MRKWLQKIGIISGVWAIVRAIWEAIGHVGNLQTVWDIVKDWPAILQYCALVLASWWFPLALSVACLVLWFFLTRKRSQKKAEVAPTSSAWKDIRGFRIEALAPIPDLKNITQVAWEKGKVIFTGDAALSVKNVLPAQGIDLVHFRLLSITPPMDAVKAWKVHTQDAILERTDFGADIPATLVAGKASTVKLFKVSRPPLAAKSLKDVSVEFYGKWPDEHYAVFTPQERHELVVEVTGNGVSREEATFELRFFCEKNESVFSIKTIRSAVGKA
jgi:hypothetical protein